MDFIVLLPYMIGAVLFFLLIDFWRVKRETEYFPLFRKTLAIYWPYTIIRLIIMLSMFWLFVQSPEYFGFEIDESLSSNLPLIAFLLVPLAYLLLFSIIGGTILKQTGFVEELTNYWSWMNGQLMRAGRDAAAERLGRKYSESLNHVQTCFCNHIQTWDISWDEYVAGDAWENCMGTLGAKKDTVAATCNTYGVANLIPSSTIKGFITLIIDRFKDDKMTMDDKEKKIRELLDVCK